MVLRATVPRKKLPRRNRYIDQAQRNDKIATHRVVVENWFGRLVTFWNVLGLNNRFSETLYDTIFQLWCILKNVHVKFHPLWDNVGESYHRF